MEDINKTFNIQWVGPFHNLEDMKVYLRDQEFCSKELFNFYYFSGNKYGRGHNKSLFYSYFGIHKKADGIDKRLNNCHEHFKDFIENENLDIWIGAFGNVNYQTEPNIEDVETLFIRTYKDYLTENKDKKEAEIKESICVVNFWYKTNETPWKRRPCSVSSFDDVIFYERDNYKEECNRILTARFKHNK